MAFGPMVTRWLSRRPPQHIDVLLLISKAIGLDGMPNPIQKNAGLPKDVLAPFWQAETTANGSARAARGANTA
jgi:hypothetical protein